MTRRINFPIGGRVVHDEHGMGTVTEHMEDSRTAVTFDSGAEHCYKQISMHTLKHVPAGLAPSPVLGAAAGAAASSSSTLSRLKRDSLSVRKTSALGGAKGTTSQLAATAAAAGPTLGNVAVVEVPSALAAPLAPSEPSASSTPFIPASCRPLRRTRTAPPRGFPPQSLDASSSAPEMHLPT